MKKQFTSAISKRVFTVLFGTLMFCSLSQQSFAFGDTTKTAKKEIEITYKGQENNKLVFNINYKNELAEAFQLIIKNDQNDIIYAKRYDAKPLNTSLLFSEFPENSKLTFAIKTNKKELVEAFQITAEVKTVEEYLVKGL